MITQEYRPNKFEEVAGQPLPKRTLRSIIKDPSKAPRSLIFEGPYGSGKTTLARIFARALNCEDSSSTEPCMKCASCRESIDSSPYYVEYDAAIVGNVERIKELRDTFFINMSNGYRVITFDEVHMASNAAQNALLKALEEVRPSIYFLFATTEVEKIIPTIRSRSLELRFDVIPHDDIVKNLRGVLDQAAKGVEFSDFVLNTIATRSRGHMRNAHMYLDSLIMVGEKDFLESVRSAHDVFLKYFQAIAVKDKSAAFSALDELCTFPLADLKSDFEQVCLDMVKTLVGYKKVEGMLFDTVKSLGAETLKFVKQAVSEWVLGSFESDQTFQAAMLCLYQMFAGQGGQSVTSSAPLSGGVRRVGKQC